MFQFYSDKCRKLHAEDHRLVELCIENFFKYFHKLAFKVSFSLNFDKNERAYSTTVWNIFTRIIHSNRKKTPNLP